LNVSLKVEYSILYAFKRNFQDNQFNLMIIVETLKIIVYIWFIFLLLFSRSILWCTRETNLALCL